MSRVLWTLAIGWAVLSAPLSSASGTGPIACSSSDGSEGNNECEIAVGFGSVCTLEGICSNPFEGGCLATLLPEWKKKRVCNSEDPPEAIAQGVCQVPISDFDYMEIRIFGQNWDSVTFEYWILQIVLSEMLDVPTTIEPGIPGPRSNFYDPASPFDFGKAFDWEALKRPSQIKNGDCRLSSRKEDSYESCAHFVGQLWDGGGEVTAEMIHNGFIDPPSSLGMVGKNGWYVPKFTVQRDPTLMSYLGMQGPENRHKLAEMFHRPTTWAEYCQWVSNSSCFLPDDTAHRPPKENSTEGQHYFVEGLYNGYFRPTDKNDCQKYPTNCTGHFVAYPCFWESFVLQQLHHLDIPLEVDYASTTKDDYYSNMLEIWLAANYTKSNIIMQWWTPEVHHQVYMDTDSELQRVTLPPPTVECVHSRADFVGDDRCSADPEDLVGTAEGSCDQEALNIRKIIVTALHDTESQQTPLPEALKSPAYDVLQRFSLSELHFGELFAYQQTKRTVREAVCQWVVDNIELVEGFIPRKFPRVLQEGAQKNEALFIAAITIAAFSSAVVLATGLLVYQRRKTRVMKQAQVEFLGMLLAGAFLVSLGAIATALPPSDYTCLFDIWFINIGYTLELVPLIVKIAAINTLLQAAKKMKKIILEKSHLFGGVFAIMAVVVTYLIVWTVLDPPRRRTNYEQTDTVTDNGEYIVMVNHYCGSESKVWWTASVAWNVLLLFGATVLAFQTRQSRLSESQTLVMLIYSHLVFVVLRLITLFLPSETDQLVLARCRSIVFGLDTMFGMVIYFGPKIFQKEIQGWDPAAATNSRWTTNISFVPGPTSTISGFKEASSLFQPPSKNDLAILDDSDEKHAETAPESSLFQPPSKEDLVMIDDSDEKDAKTATETWPKEAPQPSETAVEVSRPIMQKENAMAELISRSTTTVSHYAVSSSDSLGISVRASPCDEGVRIDKIDKNSPLQGMADSGDKIIEYNGVFNADELMELLQPDASADSDVPLIRKDDGFADEEASSGPAEQILITLSRTRLQEGV